jgi:DNA (cytosine-5)-methyltransferase 1
MKSPDSARQAIYSRVLPRKPRSLIDVLLKWGQVGPVSPLINSARPQYESPDCRIRGLRCQSMNDPPPDGPSQEPNAAKPQREFGVKLVRGPFVRLDPHPLSCESEEQLYSIRQKLTRPIAVDLFCGAGGLSLGLSEAGFDVILGVDNVAGALETHRAYHPGLSVHWDLADPAVIQRVADIIIKADVTLVAGGPPCQPFSRAGRSMMRDLVRLGRRPHHDGRRDLWESFLGVIEAALPPAVLMENVPDMALDRGMVILRALIERLEGLGYSVDQRVVDTWRYGVPQFRQRLILVALRGGIQFRWPQESANRVTVENAIGDLPTVEGGWRPTNGLDPDPVASGWAPYQKPITDFQVRARSGVRLGDKFKIFDHITRPVRDDDAVAFSQMGPGTRYSELSPELKRYRDDIFDDKYKRLDSNDLSRTITAHIGKDGYWYIHPWEDRTLTVREAARLQTFPDHIRFAGPPSHAFRQIGNAVPPLLGERIGISILGALRNPQQSNVSTGDIATRLASWFRENSPRQIPWLGSESRWVVIQAEMLWGRLPAKHVPTAWTAIRSMTDPAKTLAAMPVISRIAQAFGRVSRLGALQEAANWFLKNDILEDPSTTASDLHAAPNVSQSIADLAVRVVPGENEDPVLPGYGSLRVAARFLSSDVDRRNSLTDGRLAIAKMIGGDETSHEAHLALIELANGICSPSSPKCGICPLNKWCLEASKRNLQFSLPATSRGG